MPRTGANCIQTKDGRWRAALNGHGPTSYYYGATRQEALRKRREAERRMEAGLTAKPGKQTLKAYLEDWLEGCVKPPLKSERTYALYEMNIRVHLVPTLGKLSLESLTPAHIRKLHAEKRKTLAPKTLRSIHGTLVTALNRAVKDHILRENPCSSVDLPPLLRKERVAFDLDQARTFLRALEGTPDEAVFSMAILYGIRKSELLRMKWKDIDLDKETVTVRGTKTEASRYRPLPLLPEMKAILRRHKAAQQRHSLQAGMKWSEDAYAFGNPQGAPWGSTTLNSRLDRIVAAAGLPRLRFHDLRHSCATLLFALEVDARIIQEILGHANIGITMNLYTHLLPERKKAAIGKLSALFEENLGT